jgi:dTMP kinase
MAGLFITFEGTEGSGKSTQIQLLTNRLLELGKEVISLREPGGTPIGEEIRHTLKHSAANVGMCGETELLLMNASRAQLIHEVIRPALCKGRIVLCDRFFDSTIAYQAFGRGLDVKMIERLTEFVVGPTIPDLTLLLRVPLEISESRRLTRLNSQPVQRDRLEQENRSFFERVEKGYDAIAASGGDRVRTIDATQGVEVVQAEVWRWVESLINVPDAQGERAFKTIGEYRNAAPGG